MKFKLDECMDIRLITLFSDAGHDAKTVFEEGLSGEPDKKIHSVRYPCHQESHTTPTGRQIPR